MVDNSVKLTSGDYYTTITSFEYSRTRPGDQPKTVNPVYYTLPLPISFPSDHYSSTNTMYELGIAGNVIDTLQNWDGSDVRDRRLTEAAGFVGGVGAATALFGILKGLSSKISLSELAGGAGLGAIVNEAIDTAAPLAGAFGGIVKNPKTALLFNGMNLRSFTFVFRMSPRNAKESDLLNTYITSIRNDMHPTYNKTLNSFALDYPRLFTVGYDNKLQNTQGYPKVGPSFLVDFQVSASPNGVAFYKDGNPTIVDLQMTFAEIDMATRETFAGGISRDTTTPTIPDLYSNSPNNQ